MTDMIDEAITGDVIAALSASPNVNSTKIRVHTNNRRVFLQGVVDTLEESVLACEIARRINKVSEVENDLTVTANRTISDLEITRQVNDLLVQAGLAGIGAKVEAGNAFLMGVVPSMAVSSRAIDVARHAKGVRGVISELEIAAGEPVDDITLANDVTEALSDDMRVDTMDLEVRATDGSISIHGEVTDHKQIMIATSIAEDVPGVKEVENHLKVRELIP